MKQMLPVIRISLCLIIGLCVRPSLQAQSFAHAGEYMTAIGEQYQDLMKDQWDYIKAVSRGKGARKIEKKRQQLLSTNRQVQQSIRRLPAYENDASLRDTAVTYLQLCYAVLDEDYGKIVDMEAIAEDSYDLMEAYLAAKAEASDKLDEAGDRLDAQEETFAANHNVNLLEGEKSKLSLRLEQAGKVYDYYNRVYLIFFKSYKQELYMMAAVEEGNVSSLLQNQNTLAKYAAEGLAKLDTMQAFEGDRSVIQACKNLLTFYAKEAEKDAPVLAEFFLKKETMENMKKAFEAKKPKQRTQKDVDQYNQSVEDFNNAVNSFNETNQRLNKERNDLIDDYNKTADKFTDKHVR